MKGFSFFSLLGFLTSTILAAPSNPVERDVNVFFNFPNSGNAAHTVEATQLPPLQQGPYRITTNPRQGPMFYIGRKENDYSIVGKEFANSAVWMIQPSGSGPDRYYLTIEGNPVRVIQDGLLTIIPGGNPRDQEWLITLHESNEYYVIRDASQDRQGQGWLLSAPEPDQPVLERPLVTSPTFPPAYIWPEQFVFTRLDSSIIESTKKQSQSAAPVDLKAGTYRITSPALKDRNLFIGRPLREDRSLNPKRIVTVEPNSDTEEVTWDVEPISDGKYILSIRRNIVVPLGDSLFASLLPPPGSGEWFITYQDDQDAYTIENADDDRATGWWLPDEEGTGEQVRVRPLDSGSSPRSTLVPKELFNFVRVDNYIEESSKGQKPINVNINVEEL